MAPPAYFVDANVLIYAVTPGPRREPALELLEAVAEGSPGVTSVAVLEEVWHLELSGRIPGLEGHTERSRRVFADVLAVTANTFDLALGVEAPAELGANDRLHVGSCIEHGIATLVSADRAFDGIASVDRVDLLDPGSLRALIG